MKKLLRLAIEDKNKVIEKLKLSKLPENYFYINIKECILGVDLEIEAKNKTKNSEKLLDILVSRLRSIFGDDIYTEGNQNLPEIVGYLLYLNNLTISCAESCTGGLVSCLLTDVAGSSAYFKGSIIAYSDNSKIKLLNIPQNLIDKAGSVSKDVAEYMCRRVASFFSTDTAISTTGIAGPTSYRNLPIGLVYIGLYYKKKVEIYELNYKEVCRLDFKMKSALKALDLLRRKMLTS